LLRRKSEFRGVFQGESGRWTARITVSGKKTSLGTFDTEAEAAAGYDSE
jgi:hypothetical protein